MLIRNISVRAARTAWNIDLPKTERARTAVAFRSRPVGDRSAECLPAVKTKESW